MVKWTIEYDNSDTSSCEWWTVTDENRHYRTYSEEDAIFLAEKLNQDLIGLGYIAFYEFDYAVRLVEGSAKKVDYIKWWVVKKEFWEENHYIDDQELELEIPEFAQNVESCFLYHPTYPSNDLELQSQRLKDLGFEIRKWEE
jgi:hypothetical protein